MRQIHHVVYQYDGTTKNFRRFVPVPGTVFPAGVILAPAYLPKDGHIQDVEVTISWEDGK